MDGTVFIELIQSISMYNLLKNVSNSTTMLGISSIDALNKQFNDNAMLNTQYWMNAHNAKAQSTTLSQKELVFSITLIGTLLFSAVLMYMALQFPKYSWILCLAVSLAILAGTFTGCFGIKAPANNNLSVRDYTTQSPFDQGLNMSIPFIIFTCIICGISAFGVLIVWFTSKKKIDE